ncbi:MYB and HSA domain-containing protein [Phyllosticta capitalensis]
MSLESFRSSAEVAKRHELLNSRESRKRKLRELYTVTAYINANQAPSFQLAPTPDARESEFLDENEIAQGRYFREETLPLLLRPPVKPPQPPPLQDPIAGAPTPPQNKPPSTNDVPESSNDRVASATTPVAVASPAAPQDIQKPSTPAPSPPRKVSDPDSKPRAIDDHHAVVAPSDPAPEKLEKPSAHASRDSTTGVDARVADTQRIAPPLNHVSPNRTDSVAQDKPVRRPKTIHLPPKEVQEQKIRDRAQERAALRTGREEEHLAVAAENGNAEAASSPSSTLGPHSANTSRADQHSPATSPDEETAAHDAAFHSASSKTPSSERVDARVSPFPGAQADEVSTEPHATPDAQLRLEEEQAIRQVRDVPNGSKDSDQDGPDQASDKALGSRVPDGPIQDRTAPDPSREVGKEASAADTTENAVQDGPVKSGDSSGPLEQQGTTITPNLATDQNMEDVKTEPSQVLEARDPARESNQKTGETRPSDLGHQKAREGNLSSVVPRARTSEHRSKKKSKATTVVFAKHDKTLVTRDGLATNRAWAELQGASQDPDKDYLIGMFDFQAHSQPFNSCRELLERATKTYTTSNKYASIREQQDYKILKRIYTLQHANRWSLRQMEKSPEPPRPASFHDSLLSQMKWMRTDFREERKWKTAAARNVAEWCAEWVAASPQKRASLQVKAKRPMKRVAPDQMEEDIPSPPELVASGLTETETESFLDDDDEYPLNPHDPLSPAALFSMGHADVVARIDHTPAAEKLFSELPSFESKLTGLPSPSVVGNETKSDPDIIPVSKVVASKFVPQSTEPPRKRSRYEFEEDEEAPNTHRRTTSERSNASTPSLRFSKIGLPPEQSDVALFLPENRHVRDRLHAGHAFRPPSEFAMPSTAFFESRSPSLWLWDEDQRLRSLVKEYQFNWSLVAASLSQSSTFIAGAERRSPWECFERWMQLEGLPGEMGKTPYFRTYHARLEAAARTVTAQYQAQQQQAQQSGHVMNPPRRRTAQPIRVERRKNTRYLALIDAMRKQARKRETAAHKQQEAAKAAAMRKAHEAAPVKTSVYTPQEFSKLKYDREQKLQERQEEVRRQMLMAQRQAIARPGQMPGQPGGPAQQRNGTPGNAHGQSNIGQGAQNGQLHPSMGMQGRPHPAQMQGIANGAPAMQMGLQGMPQAQMQMNMQGQRLQPQQTQDMRMAMQRQNFNNMTQQQRIALQQQQMSQGNNMSGMSMNGNMQSPSTLAASVGTPKMNGTNTNTPRMNGIQGSSESPRMSASNQGPLPQALSSGHIPQITNLTYEIQNANPGMSFAEASRVASERITQKMAAARQNALNAAAGATGAGAAANASAHLTPSPFQQHAGLATAGGSVSPNAQQQAYQQQMRQHMLQRQQQQSQPPQQTQGQGGQGSPGIGSVRPESRSATPQNPHGQMGHQGSPRAPMMQAQGSQQSQVGSR